MAATATAPLSTLLDAFAPDEPPTAIDLGDAELGMDAGSRSKEESEAPGGPGST